jgi:hypothetical protein
MTLTFKRQDSYGRARYYPSNAAARAVVDITGRVCLNPKELLLLQESGGFTLVIETETPLKEDLSGSRSSK